MFREDSGSESLLQFVNVPWEYRPQVTFDQLKNSWWQENLGRSQAIVAAAVEKYGNWIGQGSAAPAPILWENPSNRVLEVADGVQRLAAAEKNSSQSFSAYVVIGQTRSVFERLRVFANSRLHGGFQETDEWTLERAITALIAKDLMTVEEVAKWGGWSQAAVRDKKVVIDIRQRIRGVGGPENLSDGLCRMIAKSCELDDFGTAPDAIAELTNSIEYLQFNVADAAPYITQFFSGPKGRARTYAHFHNRLDAFNSDPVVRRLLKDPRKKRYRPLNAGDRIYKSLQSTLTTIKNAIGDDEQDIGTAEEFFQVLNQIKRSLDILFSKQKRRVTNGRT